MHIIEPILPGMRICLNPENSRYKYLNEIFQGSAGYLINYENCSHKDIVKIWKSNQRHALEAITVFDCDKEASYRLNIKEILLINNTPSIDIRICFFRDGNIHYAFDGRNNKIIEKKVIYQQIDITTMHIYDENWRKQTLKEINE